MTQFEDVLETILEEYARRDSEGEFDTWEETDAFVKEKAEILLAYVKEEPVSEELEEAKWLALDELTPTGVEHKLTSYTYNGMLRMFEKGTEWQKEQMKEALRTEYEKGRHDALEEMKKSKQC